MNYKKVQLFSKENKHVKELYLRAFPEIERVPYFMLVLASNVFCKNFSLKAIYFNNEFAGMIFSIFSGDWVMLMFFAVDEKHRCKGLGEQIMSDVKASFKYVTVIMESMRVECDNPEQRKKRYAFYRKCGLTDTGYTYIDNAGEKYDIIANDESFDCGNFRFKEFEKMSWRYRIIEKKSEFIRNVE